MHTHNCPFCGQANRVGARFCAGCGKDMSAPDAPGVIQKAAGVAAQAGRAVAPVAQQAAVAGWRGGKRGAGFLARVLTLGGRAAYTEITNPSPIAAGQITGPLTPRVLATPLEGAAVIFAVFVLFGWLVIFLPEVRQIALAIGGSVMALFALNFAGVRRPFFTTMTFDRFFRGSRQVKAVDFHLHDRQSNQSLRVEMRGTEGAIPLVSGMFVQVYGVRDKAQGVIRAWRVDAVDQNWQTYTTFLAPRLIPLTVGLFLPALVALVAWLIKLLVTA